MSLANQAPAAFTVIALPLLRGRINALTIQDVVAKIQPVERGQAEVAAPSRRQLPADTSALQAKRCELWERALSAPVGRQCAAERWVV